MTPTIAHILVPTDFSTQSKNALHFGLELARRYGASLHVLHVLDLAITPGWTAELPVEVDARAMHAQEIAEAERDLAAFLPHDGQQVPVTTSVLVGSPQQAIIEVATNLAVDLIVMSTQGRSGLAHTILVSVADHVIRTAPCPVLIVRNKVTRTETGSGSSAGHAAGGAR